eukprot:1142435-Pelagomonas_calceolata.AAC.3
MQGLELQETGQVWICVPLPPMITKKRKTWREKHGEGRERPCASSVARLQPHALTGVLRGNSFRILEGQLVLSMPHASICLSFTQCLLIGVQGSPSK